MRLTARLCLLSVFGLTAACDEQAILHDSKVKKDGGHEVSVGQEGARPDGGPSKDVVIVNDTAPAADCRVAPSCGVLFSYPKGSESTCELFGDFNGWKTGVAMTLVGSSWQTTLTLNNAQQVLYKFVLDGKTWVSDPANPKRSNDGFKNSILDVACPPGCSKLDAGPKKDTGPKGDTGPAPDTGTTTSYDWRNAVMYFVLIDRFHDGDKNNSKTEPGVDPPANWYGGDLKGVLAKLQANYFSDLGVNVLWLSSPVDAPSGKYAGDDGHYYTGYHGYWPAELDKVEEHLGDLTALQQVVAEAHKQGIRVILDYVMNHVHSSSSTYTNNTSWFWSLQYNGKSCVCGDGCSWDYSPEKERCWFRDYLPDFNFTVTGARQFSVQNAMKWAKDSGCDGFRLDAVKHIELSWVTELRSTLNAQPPKPGEKFYLVGETYSSDKGTIKSYINPSMLDGQFDFPMRAQLVKNLLMRQGTMYDLDSFLNGNDGYYGSSAIMGTFLGNHDLPRSINLCEDTPQFGDWDSGKSRSWSNQPSQPGYDRAYQRLGVGFTALLTLPGIPLVYYGDEVGLAGGGDPDNRRPMPWSGTSTDQDNLRTLIGKLTKIRAAHPALRYGARKQVWINNDVYAYEMTSGSDKVVVVLNRSDSTQTVNLTGSTYTDLLTGGTVTASSVSMSPRSSRILQ
jgi:glycosidase